MTPPDVGAARRPWRQAAAISALAALLAVAAYALFTYARSTAAQDFDRTRSELERLRDERRMLVRELRGVRAENADLRRQAVFAERSQQIDGEACAAVKQSLASLQAEAADLREQIVFYRGVMAPDLAGKPGVRVLEARLTPQARPGQWRYDIVLVQSIRHDRKIGGQLRLAVAGASAGSADLKKLEVPQNTPFSFKYFQEFSGQFVLPREFRPRRLIVSLAAEGEAAVPAAEEFDWDKIRIERPGADIEAD